LVNLAFNDNGVAPAVTFSDRLIVDAGFFLTGDVDFNPEINSIQLAAIVIRGNDLYFEFRPDSKTNLRFLFKTEIPDSDQPVRFETIYTSIIDGPVLNLTKRNDSFTQATYAEVLGVIQWWNTGQDVELGWGYLVIGDLGELFSPYRDQGLNLTFVPTAESAWIEPGQVNVLFGTSVHRLMLANSRTIQLPDPCYDGVPEIPLGDEATSVGSIIGGVASFPPSTITFDGDVVVHAGYNAVVTMQKTSNRIEIGASQGGGVGIACDDDVDDDLFEPTADSYDYYGYVVEAAKVRCSETILTINGVRPDDNGRFEIIGANGINFTVNVSDNKLTIQAKFDNLSCFG
jgi:hypothetical protein